MAATETTFTTRQECQEQSAVVKKRKEAMLPARRGSSVGVMCGMFAVVMLLIAHTFSPLFLHICIPVCGLV